MQTIDYLKWFQDLEREFHSLKRLPKTLFEGHGGQKWVTEAHSALEAVFPPAHACRRDWGNYEQKLNFAYGNANSLPQLFGVFQAAHRLLQEGRIRTLNDAVRAETEVELLDQADMLRNTDRLAAATVIAGGALETHLRNLLVKYSLPIPGAGSINAYNLAIAQARNNGTTTNITPADTSQITAWGQMRNGAAHDPGNYKGTKEQVDLMVRGIRDFIARTT